MRQVLKWTLAIAVCLALLVPSAWGRSKDYLKGHPNGDDSTIGEAASVPPGTVIVVLTSVGGVLIPIIVDVPDELSNESEPTLSGTME